MGGMQDRAATRAPAKARRGVMVVLASVLAVTASGCWPMWGHDAGHTGSSPETGTGTVATVAGLGGSQGSAGIEDATFDPGPVVVPAGLVGSAPTAYVTSSSGTLEAINAVNGSFADNRLWSAPNVPSQVPAAVSNDGVVIVASTDGHVYGFDMRGSLNCDGTPTVCSPLWTAPMGGASISAPTLVGKTVYVGSDDGNVYGFPTGGTGATCTSATPRVCGPVWKASLGTAVDSSPAVVNGVLYVTAGGRLVAFDATGASHCTAGTPRVCTALWSTATLAPSLSSPAVADGKVFVAGTLLSCPRCGQVGLVETFAAAGCGQSTCSTPLWTWSATGSTSGSSPAVANGAVFVGTANGLVALDEGTGMLRWRGGSASFQSSPVVAAGVVFASAPAYDETSAFDVAGQTNCTAGTCSPIAGVAGSHPVVSDGMLFTTEFSAEQGSQLLWSADCPSCDVTTLSPPAAVASGAYRAVFAGGYTVHERAWANGTWQPWTTHFGDDLVFRPAVAAAPDGTVHVFVSETSLIEYVRSATGVWTELFHGMPPNASGATGVPLISPAAATIGSLAAFAIGEDGNVWESHGGMTDWINRGRGPDMAVGPLSGYAAGPSTGVGTNFVGVFVIAPNGALDGFHFGFDGLNGWHSYGPPAAGVKAVGQAAVIARGTNSADVFVLGSDGQLYDLAADNGGPFAWHNRGRPAGGLIAYGDPNNEGPAAIASGNLVAAFIDGHKPDGTGSQAKELRYDATAGAWSWQALNITSGPSLTAFGGRPAAMAAAAPSGYVGLFSAFTNNTFTPSDVIELCSSDHGATWQGFDRSTSASGCT